MKRAVSSAVEQWTFNPLVDGSIPSRPTIFKSNRIPQHLKKSTKPAPVAGFLYRDVLLHPVAACSMSGYVGIPAPSLARIPDRYPKDFDLEEDGDVDGCASAPSCASRQAARCPAACRRPGTRSSGGRRRRADFHSGAGIHLVGPVPRFDCAAQRSLCSAKCGSANQDALRVYEVHQPLALTSLPGNSWQSP